MVAGRINPDWLIDAQSNVNSMPEIAGWFEVAGNFFEVSFGDGGEVHANGQWLDQDTIDKLCARIDAGI